MRDFSGCLARESLEALRDLDFGRVFLGLEELFFLDWFFRDFDFDFEVDLDGFLLVATSVFFEAGFGLDLEFGFGLDFDFFLVGLSFDFDRVLDFLACDLLLFFGLDLPVDLLLDLLLERVFFEDGVCFEADSLVFFAVSGLLRFLRRNCMPSPSTSEEDARGDTSAPLWSILGVSSNSSPTKVQSSSTTYTLPLALILLVWGLPLVATSAGDRPVRAGSSGLCNGWGLVSAAAGRWLCGSWMPEVSGRGAE